MMKIVIIAVIIIYIENFNKIYSKNASVVFLDSTKLKIVEKKITTFFKQRVSIIR